MVSKVALGIEETFIRAPKKLRNCTLMGLFCPKQKVFHVKIFSLVCSVFIIQKVYHVMNASLKILVRYVINLLYYNIMFLLENFSEDKTEG